MKKFLFRYLTVILIAIVMAVPIVYLMGSAFYVDVEVWSKLLAKRVPILLVNSIALIVTVMIGSFLLGGILAFIIERTNIPFKKILRPLLVSPLIIPCYIIGICYINFFGINGIGEKFFTTIGLPSIKLPNIYGFWGAAGILILGSYPYVYAIVKASMLRLDPAYSEAARCMGATRWQRLWQINLPLLFPAFSAGAVLVALYVLSDFGVVSLLRFPTFVSTIYDQMSGRYDYTTATALSSFLLLITFVLFLIQEKFIKNRHYVSPKTKISQCYIYDLKQFKIPITVCVFSVVCAGLIIPLSVLIYWSLQSFQLTGDSLIWSVSVGELIKSGMNSLFLASFVATLAVILSIPLGYLAIRQPQNRLSRSLIWFAQAGVALPGVLIALSLSLIFSQWAPKLNFSITALVLAFLIHFYAQGFQMTRAGLTQISKNMEESARLLGYGPFKIFWYITRPLLMPALMTGWILVFLSSMRELPASLLLRPAGFDPLTVKVWIAASEGFYEQAALPALFLVILSLPLVFIMTKSKGKYQFLD